MTSTSARGGRVRLADVARLAGVSTPTASKIINGVSGVSARPETRERVLHAAAELGYRPSVSARALAGAPTRAIALLVEDLTRPMHSRTIHGVYLAGGDLGYSILIAEDSTGGRESIVELVSAGYVDGVIIASSRHTRPLPIELDRHYIPHVFLNRAVHGSNRNVTMRLDVASELVVRSLVNQGHRIIGHIAGPTNVESARQRTTSFERIADAYGVSSRPIAHAMFDERSGASATRTLLSTHPDITAIYTSSTTQAAGAISYITRTGRRIPTDISLIAYGDAPLAEHLVPALDTVAMPLEEMGKAAVIAVAEQINGAIPHDIVIGTPPNLIRRESTSAAHPLIDRATDGA